jgi:hypothetical protein
MSARDRALELAACAVALIAAALAWWSTQLYGLGVDGDAVWNLSAGVNFAHGRGFVTCRDEVFSLWPPLYPALIAALEFVGAEPLAGLRVLHVLALALSVLLAARLAFTLSGSRWAALAAAGSMALSSRTQEYTVQVVSETFFVPLVLGALLVAVEYLRAPSRGRFNALLALSAAACLQRYLGVALVLTVAFALFTAQPGPWWGRARCSALYAFGSLAPLAAWFARNYALEGAWTGGRDETPLGAAEVLREAAERLRDWPRPEAWPEWSGWLALALLAALVARWFADAQRETRVAAALVGGFAVVHALLVVGLASFVTVDRVGDRLLLPSLPPAIALVWAALFSSARSRPAFALAVALVLAAWGAGAQRSSRFFELWRTEGAGTFHTRGWQEHPVTRALATVAVAEPCWSNAPELIWLVQRRRGRFVRSGPKAWERVGREAAAGGGSLVWFQHDGRPKAFLAELEAHVETAPLAPTSEGLLLALSPR